MKMAYLMTHTLRRFATAASALAVALAIVGAAPGAASAQTVTIKMATLVPEGSSWHLVLKEVADKWSKISGGKVRVIIYPSGTQGDDPDVVRKIRLGTLNAGVLTSVGLAEVDRSVYAVSIPMAFSDYDEVYYVLEKMRAKIESTMESKGFVMLNWADGGWLRFFTQKPVAVPNDLKSLKLFQWAGDTPTLEIWKAAGFNPVPLPSTELATGLQTGLVQAFAASPQVAVITRYFENAKNMTDIKWALLLGGTVIAKSAWDRIPADMKPALLQAMHEAGSRLQSEIRKSDQTDIDAMTKRGLNVIPVDAKARELWRATAEGAYGKVRGGFVPAEAFDEALRYRDEYRKLHPAAKAPIAK
jgi:TRAP-type C4-dicarboxylate transport system substrate-binding protein